MNLSQKDKRSRKIIFLAHCLLNQNAKVGGLASYPGTFEPLARVLLKAGVGLVQLPCPEMALFGPKRCLGTDTAEQYDTLQYRAICHKLALAAVREMKAYRKAGYKVLAVLGVEGSPSCSVRTTPRLVAGKRVMVRGSGLFIEALRNELRTAGMRVPVVGVPESSPAKDLQKALTRVQKLIDE